MVSIINKPFETVKTRFQGKSEGDSKIIAKFAKLMKFVGLRKLTTDTMGETLRSPCNAKR